MTTATAADTLGISRRRVVALIQSGRLRACHGEGREWVIQAADLRFVLHRRAGRPRCSHDRGMHNHL